MCVCVCTKVVAVWNKRNVSYAVGYEGECVKRGSWIRTKLTKVSASTAWSLLMTVCVLVYVCVWCLGNSHCKKSSLVTGSVRISWTLVTIETESAKL